MSPRLHPFIPEDLNMPADKAINRYTAVLVVFLGNYIPGQLGSNVSNGS